MISYTALQVLYYGLIKQSTGEDWTNAKLSLSTANPSIGGSVPELGMQQLKFKRTRIAYKSIPKRIPQSSTSFISRYYSNNDTVCMPVSVDYQVYYKNKIAVGRFVCILLLFEGIHAALSSLTSQTLFS